MGIVVADEEDLQSSPGTQIYIALCIGSQDAQTPCRTTPSRGALVAMATPPSRRPVFGVEGLYMSGMWEEYSQFQQPREKREVLRWKVAPCLTSAKH